MKAKVAKTAKPPLDDVNALFRAWCEAAEEWRQFGSEARAAACRKARSAYYTAARGNVPALKKATKERDNDHAA